MVAATQWTVDAGEEARLTPEGPTAGVIESRGPLPLRVRSTLGLAAGGRAHPGTAVVLGKTVYEVVADERADRAFLYRLEPWPPDQAIRDRVSYGPRLVRAAQEQRRRERRAKVTGPLSFVLELVVALLPAPERSPIAQRLSLDLLRGSLLLAAIQVLGAGALWPAGLVQFFHDRQAAVAGEITREQREITQQDIAEAIVYSRFGPLLYLVSGKSLVLLYVGFTGVARFASVRLAGQPLGDPLLALALALLRRRRRQAEQAARLAELGPERPDRVSEDGAELVVVAAREKPEWNERVTIQVRERFYRVRHVAEQPDGQWKAIAYRLAPLDAGLVIRRLVRYEPPEPRPQSETRAAAAAALESPPAADVPRVAEASRRTAPAPSGVAAAEPGKPESGRMRWRVDAGEEARLTPEGPSAAVIESLGSLPLRARSEALGVHHRPEFAGTCVVLGGARFEVIEEQPLDTGFRYRLDPWPREIVFRHAVEYGPALVRAAQRERERAVFREQAATYSKWLAPLIGLLPEPRQVIACERYGLDAADTTLAGAVFEALAFVALMAFVNARAAVLFMPLMPFVVLGVMFPAIARGFAALAWQEVAGSALLGAAFNLGQEWRHVARRFDPTVLPLTRDAFWARLALPDRLEKQADGSLIVRSIVPHLSWGTTSASRTPGQLPALQVGDDYWNVAALPAVVDKGRLVYAYQLWPARDPLTFAERQPPSAPDPRHYQNEVLEDVAREWDDIHKVAPWLVCLLPESVQERAYRQRGGADAARRFTLITSGAELLLMAWFGTGAGVFNWVSAALVGYDGARRLYRSVNGEYAPSMIGWAFSDYLRPERVPYHAHRDAERETLAALRQPA